MVGISRLQRIVAAVVNCGSIGTKTVSLGKHGKSEIYDADSIARTEQNTVRIQISMDKARPMSCNESRTDLNGNMKSFSSLHLTLVQLLAQSGSPRKFGRNECRVVLKTLFNRHGYVSM